MNLKQACKCLGIKENQIECLSEKQLRNKYHILALKYHPDKNNSLDAKDRFQELQEAYEAICIEKNIPKQKMDYRSILKQYFNTYIKDSDVVIDLLYDKLNNNIENILEKCSRQKLISIYSFLLSQQDIVKIPDDILKKIQQVIYKKTNHIALECSFKDMWYQKIYVLEVESETLYIPLWHCKLDYTIQDIVCIVTCKCKEPNIIIDRENNIHITMDNSQYSDNNYYIPVLGHRYIPSPSIINNTIVLKGEGIPRINFDNIYDNTQISDIILTLLN
jgi:hypothetical protein